MLPPRGHTERTKGSRSLVAMGCGKTVLGSNANPVRTLNFKSRVMWMTAHSVFLVSVCVVVISCSVLSLYSYVMP